MNAINGAGVARILGIIVLQVLAVALLPRSRGFTVLGVTTVILVLYSMSYWLLAKLIVKGIDLGVVVPLLAATIPLATIPVGIFLNGESTSPTRVGLLVLACILIGLAARS